MKTTLINRELIDQLKAVYQTQKQNNTKFYSCTDIIYNLCTYVPGYDISFFTTVGDEDTNPHDYSSEEMKNAFSITYSDYAKNNVYTNIEQVSANVDELVSEIKNAFREITGNALRLTELSDKNIIYINKLNNSFEQQQFYVKKVYEFNSKFDELK
jgi:hypothetical protein